MRCKQRWHGSNIYNLASRGRDCTARCGALALEFKFFGANLDEAKKFFLQTLVGDNLN